MKLNIVILFACTLLIANAWWDKGHMLVSQIAYNYLADTKHETARDKFKQLI